MNQYAPDSVSPPGDTLRELMEQCGLSRAALADRTDIPRAILDAILDKGAPITMQTARALASEFDISAEFWLTRDRHYRASL